MKYLRQSIVRLLVMMMGVSFGLALPAEASTENVAEAEDRHCVIHLDPIQPGATSSEWYVRGCYDTFEFSP